MIRNRLGIEPVNKPGRTGQFEVFADGERIAGRGGNWLTRSFGWGYPALEAIVEQLVQKRQTDSNSE